MPSQTPDQVSEGLTDSLDPDTVAYKPHMAQERSRSNSKFPGRRVTRRLSPSDHQEEPMKVLDMLGPGMMGIQYTSTGAVPVFRGGCRGPDPAAILSADLFGRHLTSRRPSSSTGLPAHEQQVCPSSMVYCPDTSCGHFPFLSVPRLKRKRTGQKRNGLSLDSTLDVTMEPYLSRHGSTGTSLWNLDRATCACSHGS